jgi:hypothetical protein
MHVHDDDIEEVVYESVKGTPSTFGYGADEIDGYRNKATIYMIRKGSHVSTASAVSGRVPLSWDYPSDIEDENVVDLGDAEADMSSPEVGAEEEDFPRNSRGKRLPRQRGGLDDGLGLSDEVRADERW